MVTPCRLPTFASPCSLDPAVAATASRIRVNAAQDYGFTSARLQANLDNGDALTAEIKVAKGHPGNPIGWPEMRDKFSGLVDFAPAESAAQLFSHLQGFGERRKVDLLRRAAGLIG